MFEIGAVGYGSAGHVDEYYSLEGSGAYDIAVVVLSGFEALSNGVLVATRPQPNGMVRWHWRGTKPQNTYTSPTAKPTGDRGIAVER